MQDEAETAALLRALPQVQRLLETDAAEQLVARFGRRAVTDSLRATLDDVRLRLRTGDPAPVGDILHAAARRLHERAQPHLRRTINATGIVLHTNLGRAPLAAEALAAMSEAATGYANLEFDLETGKRGARTGAVEALLCTLTGAEASLAVNNGAAAILLAIAALASGGEVIVSRGELVEIGGGFRIPDIIGWGGAKLVEVGTTNRTRADDYQTAINERTRALLKVHQSNFRIVGFTAEAGMDELAALARERGIPLVADLGSGDLAGGGVARALAAGADLVTFSGDKLLGGPQAGLLAGRREAIHAVRRNPLMRAMRLDKVSLAALEATLILHRDAPAHIPVVRMLAQSEAELECRAQLLARALSGGQVIHTDGFAGGGALPDERIASRAVALTIPLLSADELARRLRLASPPIVGRIVDGSFALDMLAVADQELPEIAAAVARLA